MFEISKTASRFSVQLGRSLKDIEFQEECCICGYPQQDGTTILRHLKSKRVVCALCVLKISEVK